MPRNKRTLNHALLKDVLGGVHRSVVETLFFITDAVVGIQCDWKSEFTDFDLCLRIVVKRDCPENCITVLWVSAEFITLFDIEMLESAWVDRIAFIADRYRCVIISHCANIVAEKGVHRAPFCFIGTACL